MAILFVVGAMNLIAIALLSCMVALEKLAPNGELFARIGGVALIAWAAWLALL